MFVIGSGFPPHFGPLTDLNTSFTSDVVPHCPELEDSIGLLLYTKTVRRGGLTCTYDTSRN